MRNSFVEQDRVIVEVVADGCDERDREEDVPL